MNGSCVLREQREPNVVRRGDGSAQRMFVDVADREVLVEAAAPAYSDRHGVRRPIRRLAGSRQCPGLEWEQAGPGGWPKSRTVAVTLSQGAAPSRASQLPLERSQIAASRGDLWPRP